MRATDLTKEVIMREQMSERTEVNRSNNIMREQK